MSLTNFSSTLRIAFTALTLSFSLLACAHPTHHATPTTKQVTPSVSAVEASSAQAKALPANLTACPTTRADMCAAIHKPVCAVRDTGVRCVTAPCPSEAPTTFSNACSACRDPKVQGYTEGACGKTVSSM